jgi:hypothetical protein
MFEISILSSLRTASVPASWTRAEEPKMNFLVAASIAALIEAGTVTAMAGAPVVPPPAQAAIQQGDLCQAVRRPARRVHTGRWRRRGMWFRHRQWRCRWGQCRWYYW